MNENKQTKGLGKNKKELGKNKQNQIYERLRKKKTKGLGKKQKRKKKDGIQSNLVGNSKRKLEQ